MKAMDGRVEGGSAQSLESRPLVFADLFAAADIRSLRWEPFRDGIEISRLYHHAGGPSAAFLRYAPGARLPRHEHGGYEHILVLSGSQTDDNGEHHAGAMLVHPPGTSHAVFTASGCVVLAVWEKPVVFLPDPPAPNRPDGLTTGFKTRPTKNGE